MIKIKKKKPCILHVKLHVFQKIYMQKFFFDVFGYKYAKIKANFTKFKYLLIFHNKICVLHVLYINIIYILYLNTLILY